MTKPDDKAAREAFEKSLGLKRFAQNWGDEEKIFVAGYQAAHDAAMASEPDVQKLIARLRALHREYGEGSYRDSAEALESLLLQLQAAQQREAECREALAHIRRCVRWQPSMNANVVVIHDPSSTMEQIDAALATQPASKGETT